MQWKLPAATAAIALAFGFGGGIASHAAFPAQRGPRGRPGATGATGATGSAANINLNKIGFCVDTSYGSADVTLSDGVSTQNLFYVSNVNIYAPTDNQGTLSCGNGGNYFTLEPVLPNGQPSNYTP